MDWSWRYHCHPLYDPRPIWCRPVVYVAAGPWTWCECPVWHPLPVVTCGTWVDVDPVVVGPQFDLQLLAVRFVDPGHPQQQLGPRYRIWFRNNSDLPITQPFDVLLLASKDVELAGNLPRAGVRVTAVEAGGVQSIDVRLPVEVYQMGLDALEQPIAFTTLHVLVDANREVPEAFQENNGERLAVADILPVDPSAFEVTPGEAAAGSEIMLAGEGFGPEPGQVLVHLGGLELEGEIAGWYDLGVRLTLPKLPLAGPTKGEVIVIRSDGAAANPIPVTVMPPP